jgi:hypothetical protein
MEDDVSKATGLVKRDRIDYFSRRVPAEVADAYSALLDKSIVIVCAWPAWGGADQRYFSDLLPHQGGGSTRC